MDKLQKLYDRIFEEPTTLKAARNKLLFLKREHYDTPFRTPLFTIIENEIIATTDAIRKDYIARA